MRRFALAFALALPLVTASALAQEQQAEAGSFDEQADAGAALAQALIAAREQQSAGDPQRVLAIFGANWCHDSRDLVALLERPRIAGLIAQRYQVVLIDVGVPQTGNGRNLELAARHGVDEITGTPSVLVLDASGELLNSPVNARAWRNASSRSEREVYRFLRQYAKPQD